MLAVTFYFSVVAVHVMAIVLAFGVTFAYPILVPFFAKQAPQAMPTVHEVQERIGRFLITPFATLALLTGIYLASKPPGGGDLFGKIWVQVPLGILIVLLGLGGGFFAPRERKLAELARRDAEAGGPPSDEYMAAGMTVAKVGALASVLILVAIFFMVAKPGA